jgi:acyl-CoA synthetase (NDP forming)
LFREVAALFRPKSLAIIGASDSSRGGWALEIYGNLEHCGFPAKIYLVNPKRTSLWGRPVYPNFAAIPEPVDLALTIIPPAHVADTLDEAAAHGLKCALVYAAQFGENGDPEGLSRGRQLTRLCERGLRISGPNCMGVVSVRERLLLYPSKRVRALPPGPLGVVFQSGGTFQFWLQQAAVRGLGFSYAVSSGNELDLDVADYLNFLVEDESTRIIACMVEGIRRPDAFMQAAEKALAAGKPILMVKLGRSERGRAAASSHTGAIAGDDRVFDAACRKYGIVRCPSLDDLMETCLAFLPGRLPKGQRIGMAGYSGGAKGLFLDYANDIGAELADFTPETKQKLLPLIDPGLAAENPLDVGANNGVQAQLFSRICQIVCADPNVDIVTVQGLLPTNADDPYDPAPLIAVKASTDKPLLAFGRIAQNVSEIGRNYQAATGVPFIQGLPETARALQALVSYAEATRRGVRQVAAEASSAKPSTAALDDLIAHHGLTPPRSAMAKTPEEAAVIAASIGFPVAAKLVSAVASHKTEVGGVSLHLADAEAVRRACATMAARLHVQQPAATIDGFLIQEMVDGLELILGVREDPQFGPFMVVGLGGVMVEALDDVALRLLPVNDDDARSMLGSLRSARLLDSFRNRAPRDVDAVVRAMIGLSALFSGHRTWFSDIEINPLIVLPAGQGVRAVDVRLVERTS